MMTTLKEQEQEIHYPPDNDDVWENRSLWDEASLKSWEPYGKAITTKSSMRSDDCTESTSKTLSTKSHSTSDGSSSSSSSSNNKSSSSTPKTKSSLSMFLDNNGGRNNVMDDDVDENDGNEMFTPIVHESADTRSKRRESIKDFGMSSCSAFDTDVFFEETASDDINISNTEISPTTSTEAMVGAPDQPVGSPRSVIIPSSKHAAACAFGTDPFQTMKKIPSPGPKRLSKTRRVDWTGVVAEDPFHPSQDWKPNDEIDKEGSTSCIGAAEDITNPKASYFSVGNEDFRKHGHDHSLGETQPVRESRSSLPAWRILQRERNRRISPDNRTSLSHSSCHVQRSTTTNRSSVSSPKAKSMELKSVSSHVPRTRPLVVINEEDWSSNKDAPLSCPTKQKKSVTSIWPEWESSSDPSLLVPPAFSALSDWLPSTTSKSPMNTKKEMKKRVRLVPKSSQSFEKHQEEGDVDINGFPNSVPGHNSVPSTTTTTTTTTTKPSPCGGKPAWKKRMQWRNRESAAVDSKTNHDETTQRGRSSLSLTVKAAAAFPASFFSLRKLDTQAASDAAAVTPTLSWAKEKTNNFSDYTITVVVDETRPPDDDGGYEEDGSGKNIDQKRLTTGRRQSSSRHQLLQKETYHVHKCIVGIGRKGSGLILEKLQQRRRRSGGITMIVKLHPICATVFPFLLDYMYGFPTTNDKKNDDDNGLSVLLEQQQKRFTTTTTTTTTTPEETICALRCLSNYFLIPSLFDEVNTYIQNDINSDNVQQYHTAAVALKDDELAEATLSLSIGYL